MKRGAYMKEFKHSLNFLPGFIDIVRNLFVLVLHMVIQGHHIKSTKYHIWEGILLPYFPYIKTCIQLPININRPYTLLLPSEYALIASC